MTTETYRDSLLIERYEDIIFELDSNLIIPANNSRQKKDNHTFSIDNSGELPPLDWYNARFNVDFKMKNLAGNADLLQNQGIVNSAFSLINHLLVKINGVTVYDCSDANQATNIKNILEYSQGYIKSQGTNEFFYLDTNRHKEERSDQAEYNSGFAARKILLDAGATVNAEIPLNRYGFFEGLENQILPNSKISIIIDFE